MKALEDLKVALAAALPTRVVTRDLLNFDQRLDADLVQGVLTIVASRESGYANYRGREAALGKLNVVVVGQIRMSESDSPSAVEDEEWAFAGEVKTFLQGIQPVEAIDLLETRFSGQLDAPYGWFAMDWEVWP